MSQMYPYCGEVIVRLELQPLWQIFHRLHLPSSGFPWHESSRTLSCMDPQAICLRIIVNPDKKHGSRSNTLENWNPQGDLSFAGNQIQVPIASTNSMHMLAFPSENIAPYRSSHISLLLVTGGYLRLWSPDAHVCNFFYVFFTPFAMDRQSPAMNLVNPFDQLPDTCHLLTIAGPKIFHRASSPLLSMFVNGGSNAPDFTSTLKERHAVNTDIIQKSCPTRNSAVGPFSVAGIGCTWRSKTRSRFDVELI